MFDLEVKEFKEAIIDLANRSNLPATLLTYVFKELAQVSQDLTAEQIRLQQKERDNQINSQNNQDNN